MYRGTSKRWPWLNRLPVVMTSALPLLVGTKVLCASSTPFPVLGSLNLLVGGMSLIYWSFPTRWTRVLDYGVAAGVVSVHVGYVVLDRPYDWITPAYLGCAFLGFLCFYGSSLTRVPCPVWRATVLHAVFHLWVNLANVFLFFGSGVYDVFSRSVYDVSSMDAISSCGWWYSEAITWGSGAPVVASSAMVDKVLS